MFFLYDDRCDMRKFFDGLRRLVASAMKCRNAGEIFVFLNRNHTHFKLMHWEQGDIVQYYERLERGTFSPTYPKGAELSRRDLVLMVDGI